MLNVLVTGAAGLIGGEVCARLVERGHVVTAMVRRTLEVRGNDGAPVAVARIVRGDVTRPGLGLEPGDHDLVIHCAAALEFDAPEAELAAVNVEGTRNAARFARASGAGLLHVSTAYVCGMQEGRIAEGPVPPGARFANNYEASKAAGERVVEAGGLPFVIARPSIVLGDSASGQIRDFPSLCNVFRLMARGKVTVFPTAPGSRLDLVPIDHVARGIVALAEAFEEAAGGHYHLVAGKPMEAAELARGVQRQAHLPDPAIIAPDNFDLAALPPLEQRVLGRLLATFGGYFLRDPRFDDARFRKVTGLACPPADAAWLDRLIEYAIEQDYLPAPSGRPGNARATACARPVPTAPRS